MRKLMLGAAMLLMLGAVVSAPASAQPKSRTAAPLGGQTQLLETVMADAKAALTDAEQNNDAISAACWTAVRDAATVKLHQQQTAGGGLMFAFQKFRDITRLNQSPLGTQLIIGCAPLVQDAKLNMLQFFTNIGAALLVKGVLF